MDSLLSVINEYRILVGAIVMTLSLLVALKVWWDKVSLFVLNIYYKLPVFGKLAKLSRDYVSTNSNVENSNQTWFSSEEALCMDYFNHYQLADKDGEHFDKCSKYLQKVDETGRNNLHILGWVLVAAMVFVEAMGFSYVLSGFTIPGASEDLQQTGAVGIAFLISVLLVAFTHYSGHELHYNGLIKKVRSIWSKQAATEQPLINDNRICFDENLDDDQPQWRQMLNRLPHNADVTPKYTVTIGAVLLIIIVAVGATYVRGKVLEQESAEAHMQTDTVGFSYSDPYENNLPPDLVNQAQKSNEDAELAAEEAYKSAGWGTFIVLAVIFVFIQLLGILIGYKTGFAGKESSKARQDMGNFKTKREFENFHQRKKQAIARTAQKNLTALQQRLSKKVSETATDKQAISLIKSVSNRNFLAYADLQHTREDESNKRDRARQAASVSPETVETPQVSNPQAMSESPEDMEARIRKEVQEKLMAEKKKKVETPEEMMARIEAEERQRLEKEQGEPA